MLYSKSGLPEESEIVLCTVTKVYYNAVFATLDEYQNKTGVIHISEIAPGRIRNIREYVAEGKKIICKVLRIEVSRGNIDLSLRRVNDKQRREKNTQLKHEQLAEKIIELLAKEMKVPVPELYKKITTPVFEHYDLLYSCFEEVVSGQFQLETLKLDKLLLTKLKEAILLRIKLPEVTLTGDLSLTTYDPRGIDVIRHTLGLTKKEGVQTRYLGGGKYHLTIKAEDYKTAEGILEQITSAVFTFMKSKNGEASFIRKEAKASS
ncbi:TPA: S1 RNA-binding domain-containing protein [Candidatus Woesearchaeota archaeon]|nr:S1 RNA-binding domain-containing protein [Candidatus Woesearchaeota archaeon]HIH46866.1 S1 RNA-binding domain-containing protein [Candidatus Woesearchaeota archaeon]